MANGLRSRLRALSIAAAAIAVTAAMPAAAVTISEGVQLTKGISLDLSGVTTCGNNGAFTTNLGVHTGSAIRRSGKSSCGDRTTVQVKDETTPFPYGRFNPHGGKWIDSNDLSRVTWNVEHARRSDGHELRA